MNLTFRTITAAAALGATMSALPSHAAGRIDHATLIAVPHGTFRGVQFTRYEAMFEGITPNNRPYRVPCQIITASDPSKGSRLLLFDWLCPSTMFTALGQEQAIGRFTLTDEFLFGQGASFATVRCQLEAIGKRSSISVPSLPWSDGLLDTASEFITSAGDEFDIVRDYVIALRQDPIALSLLGQFNRRAAFGYSASGGRLRGLLRSQMGEGLFDFSLIGGAGNGYFLPAGNTIGLSYAERAPLAGSGLEIDFNSETDVVALGGHPVHPARPFLRRRNVPRDLPDDRGEPCRSRANIHEPHGVRRSNHVPCPGIAGAGLPSRSGRGLDYTARHPVRHWQTVRLRMTI